MIAKRAVFDKKKCRATKTKLRRSFETPNGKLHESKEFRATN